MKTKNILSILWDIFVIFITIVIMYAALQNMRSVSVLELEKMQMIFQIMLSFVVLDFGFKGFIQHIKYILKKTGTDFDFSWPKTKMENKHKIFFIVWGILMVWETYVTYSWFKVDGFFTWHFYDSIIVLPLFLIWTYITFFKKKKAKERRSPAVHWKW